MKKLFVFPADAHEGPVWVASQCRLYYTTKVHQEGENRVSIDYLDFSGTGVCQAGEVWDRLTDRVTATIQPRTFLRHSGMANAMRLDSDGRALLVAEQGDHDRPAVVSRISLDTKEREVLVRADDGEAAYNSPNKVWRTQRGHLLFTDPDYGFRHGFRPPPQREPHLYVQTKDGSVNQLTTKLLMPHGIALTPDERTLFLTDTSNDGVHDDDVDLGRCQSVHKYPFDPATGRITGPGEFCFEAETGVPDGMVVTDDRLLVAGGEGILVADHDGNLRGRIDTPGSPVNLALAGNGQHLFATNDKSVLLFLDWRDFVTPTE